jgi:hypothetical protein
MLPGIVQNIKDLVKHEEKFNFETVDDFGFYEEALAFWEEYEFSDSAESLTLFLDYQGNLTKEKFFDTIKENNLCGTLQSEAFGCGQREDVRLDYIQLPAIILMQYENDTLFISQSSEGQTLKRNLQVLSAYFAGFEGNGDLTENIGQLPGDAKVALMQLELISGADFYLYINGKLCNDEFKTSSDVDKWDITDCSKLLIPGSANKIALKFTSKDIFRKYIAGGHIDVLYETSAKPAAADKIYLPAINGTINYFGAVNIPGTPSGMKIYLDYWVGDLNGTDFYVNVGDQTVYKSMVYNNFWSGSIPVSSAYLKQGVNPVRIGVNSNSTNIKEISIPLPVDAVLITDVSGSMNCRIDNTNPNTNCPTPADGQGAIRGCNDPNLLGGDTQKLVLAKCFGKEFADIILTTFLRNQIGLTAFSESAISSLELTSDYSKVSDSIDMYSTIGGTCVSCGINRARKLLAYSDREKAMVIMTDGVANVCLESSCTSAVEEAYQQAKEAFENDDIHLFTIAFGADADTALLQKIACIDNCSNFGQGSDAAEIQRIYKKFAETIAKKQTVHTKHVQGSKEEFTTPSILFDGSYIKVDYTPSNAVSGSDIKVRVSKELGCSDSFALPQDMIIENAQVLPWAENFWTEKVELNGNIFFDLSVYGKPYTFIGDPFLIQLPLSQLTGSNAINIGISDMERQNVLCLDDSLLQYIASLKPSVLTGMSFTSSVGCKWNVEFPKGIKEFLVPGDYGGSQLCKYTNASILYSNTDLYQFAVGKLLKGLDSNKDGIIDNNIDNIEVIGGMP